MIIAEQEENNRRIKKIGRYIDKQQIMIYDKQKEVRETYKCRNK